MSHSLPNRRSTGSGPEWICPKCLYPSAKSKNLSWKETKTSLPVVCKDPIWLPCAYQPITRQAYFDVIQLSRAFTRAWRESECCACGMTWTKMAPDIRPWRCFRLFSTQFSRFCQRIYTFWDNFIPVQYRYFDDSVFWTCTEMILPVLYRYIVTTCIVIRIPSSDVLPTLTSALGDWDMESSS